MVLQVKSLESELRKSQRLLEDLREKTKHEEVSMVMCFLHTAWDCVLCGSNVLHIKSCDSVVFLLVISNTGLTKCVPS